MADKRRIRRSIKQLQRIKTWQLLILLILCGFISATFLRLNNIAMTQRRDAVLSADKEGNVEVTRDRLISLQQYASGHMNASTGKFYLREQYNRDVQAAVESAEMQNASADNPNVKADATCKSRYHGYSQAYVQCVVNELANLPPSADPIKTVKFPDAELYAHEFDSPVWSPDFAGFSLLLVAVITLMIVVRLLAHVILRILLKRHYQPV